MNCQFWQGRPAVYVWLEPRLVIFSVALTVPMGLPLQVGSPFAPWAGTVMPLSLESTMTLFFDSSSGSAFLIWIILADTSSGPGEAVFVAVAVGVLPVGVGVGVAVSVGVLPPPTGVLLGSAGFEPASISS